MAYEELVKQHQAAAIRTASLVLSGEAEAEDAAQDAFVKGYLALGGFRPGALFRPWILRIVANEARNRRRSAGRRAALALRIAEDRPPDGAASSPEATILVRERREALLKAMSGLSIDDRLVIGFRYFLELGEAEMAEALGVPRGTVKSRLSRALGRLRSKIEPGSAIARSTGEGDER